MKMALCIYNLSEKTLNFEVLSAVTIKKAVFWDKTSQYVPHWTHITSLLQSSAGQCYVRFEVFTVVTMKNAVFWDVTPRGSCRTTVSVEPSASIIGVTRILSQKTAFFVKFEVLTVATMNIGVFLDVTPCDVVDCYRRFEETLFLNIGDGQPLYMSPRLGE
jgi:hypothetical protein